jgi:hypothetical protein
VITTLATNKNSLNKHWESKSYFSGLKNAKFTTRQTRWVGDVKKKGDHP